MGRHQSRSRSRSMSSSSSGRGAQSSKWDGESGYRIHVSDLATGVSRREVEKAFTKYGPINEVWVATNPPCFAFINFKHRSDADKAIRDVNGKVIGTTRVGVSWARTRTYGGRSRGSRGYSYGSYQSGGSRRRSRSRSRSGSRHRRRRPSRSRSRSASRDRFRRRNGSARDRKNSRHSSDREKSKSSRSNSRSRSRSTRKRVASGDANRKSRSPSSNAGDRHEKPCSSSSAAAAIEKATTADRSPINADED